MLAVDIVKIFSANYPEVVRTKEITVSGWMKRQNSKSHRSRRESGTMRAITAKDAFMIYETFGLPFELCRIGSGKVKILKDMDAEFKKHQEISAPDRKRNSADTGLF